MSIKTLRKRIALVAVSALGVGFLSVAPAGATGVMTIFANSSANVLTSTTCANNSTGYGSQGLVTQSGTGTSITATLLSTGKLLVFVPATASTQNTLTVSGGVINRAVGDTTDPTVSAGQTLATAASGKNICAEIIPTAAVGSVMTINSYSGSYLSTAPVGTAIVTIASANASGALSLAYSSVYVKAATTVGNLSGTSDTSDSTSGFTIPNGRLGGLMVDLADTYNSTLTSGVLEVSATNGALVKINSNYPLASSDYDTSHTGSAVYVAVKQGVANKAASTDVTVKFNGTVVRTVSLKFLGDATKIVLTAAGSQINGETTTLYGNASYGRFLGWKLYDDAGNLVADPGTVALYSGANVYVPSITVSNSASVARMLSGLGGNGHWNCGTVGKASIKVYTTNAAGATIVSNAVDAECSRNPATYSISLDKQTYAPGEIATLTVKVKDYYGGVPATQQNMGVTLADATATTCTNGAANQPTLASGALKSVVGTLSCDDMWDAKGEVKYQFVIDSTEGDFQVIFNAPGINGQYLGGAAQTASISVKAKTSAVSNAEVLAAIVKLIASINKQIRALQKSLKR